MQVTLFAIPKGKEWFVAIAALAVLIFWIVMILDVVKRPNSSINKTLWLLTVIILGPVGAGLYYFFK